MRKKIIITSFTSIFIFFTFACSSHKEKDIYPVYRTQEAKTKMRENYRKALNQWPVRYRELDVPTSFGNTHIIVSGAENQKPLILLHGSSANSTSWIYNIRSFSKKYTVYSIDIIGDIGKSVMIKKPANRKDYAAWLSEVMKRLNIRRASFVGCSYSSSIVHGFITEYPEQADKAIYISGYYGKTSFQTLFKLICYSVNPSRKNIKKMIDWMNGGEMKITDVEIAMIDAFLYRMKAYNPYLIDLSNVPSQEIENLKTPLMILMGKKDGLCDPVKTCNYIHNLNPSIQVNIIPNGGHMFYIDDPILTAELIQNFLK